MTLSSILAPRSPKLRAWLQPRRGWIGIDIGTVATKLAQLERVGDQFRFTAHWLIDDYSDGPVTRDRFRTDQSFPFQAQLKNVRSMFRGRRVAAALPLAMMELRSFELPAGTENELRNMIHEELQAETDNNLDLCFDYLETQRTDSSEGDLVALSVSAVSRDIALKSADALGLAGLDCEVLDSLPCALARAVKLCEPADSQSPIAALDIGYSSAVLIVARDGRLVFTRQLRGCGLQTLLKPIQDRLRLSTAEAKQLLEQYANPIAPKSPAIACLAKAAHTIIAEPLSQFAAEVKRTLDFIDLQFRSIVPRQLVLLGGGALVPELPDVLSAETGLPVRLWSMAGANNDSSRPDEALFGVAAALSLLAWEATACT